MFSLTNIFCILALLFIILVVTGMSNGWVFLQGMLFGLGRFAIIGVIVAVLAIRFIPGSASVAFNQSEVNTDFAYNAITDIADNPEGAYLYEEQSDQFFASLTSFGEDMGELFTFNQFRY